MEMLPPSEFDPRTVQPVASRGPHRSELQQCNVLKFLMLRWACFECAQVFGSFTVYVRQCQVEGASRQLQGCEVRKQGQLAHMSKHRNSTAHCGKGAQNTSVIACGSEAVRTVGIRWQFAWSLSALCEIARGLRG